MSEAEVEAHFEHAQGCLEDLDEARLALRLEQLANELRGLYVVAERSSE